MSSPEQNVSRQELLEELQALRKENASLKKSLALRTEDDEQLFVSLFEGLSYGASVCEPNGDDFRIIAVNSQAATMNGLNPEDLIGCNLMDVLPGLGPIGLIEAFGRVHATGEPLYLPPRLYKDDRQSAWRQYNLFRLPGRTVACIAEDVSPYVEDAEQLRINSKILQATLDASLDGIWEYNPHNDYFSFNQRLPEMLGYTPDELREHGNFCQGIVHPDDLPSYKAALHDCLHEGACHLECEIRLMSKSRKWHWVLARAALAEFWDGQSKRLVGAFTDVTSSKEADAKLRAGLELFSQAFENAQAIMMLIDPADGGVVEVNKLALQFYGYPKETFLTMRMQEINTLSAEEVSKEMEHARKEERNHFNFRHALASGEVRDVEVRSGPVLIEGRQLLFSIIHDITEKRKAEEALKKSEATLSSIFKAAPVGIGEVRRRIVGNVNQRFADMLGYSTHELKGVSARVLYPSDEIYEQVGNVKHPQMRNGNVGTIETVMRRKDGTEINILLSSSWKDEQNRTEGMIFTAQDITGLKRAREQARKARGYLHSVIDSMPSAIYCIGHDGCISLWNEQAARMASPALPLLGQKLTKVLSNFPEVGEWINEALQTHRPVARKALRSEDSGRTKFWDVLMYPLQSESISGAVVRLDDATERVHLEEAMIQSEKMLSLGGLAAGMAHEINNPLGGIMQGAQIIERRLALDLAANQKVADECGLDLDALKKYTEKRKIPQLLDGIMTGGNRAAQIVSSMLEFSRTNESRKAPVQINGCIDEVIELARSDYDLRKHYDFKKVNIIRNYAEQLSHLPCAKTEIQQVVLNLLTNAAHAMGKGKQATQSPEIRITTQQAEDKLKIIVQDNGPGIPEAMQKRIFEPFFTTKDPGEGTGLGLSVSYFIITRNHKGSLSVDSPPGGGTTFTIVLPV